MPAADLDPLESQQASQHTRAGEGEFQVQPVETLHDREIGVRHRPAHFQHLFAGGGYAAGYYAYLWAEVLDADGFEAFTEAADPFDPALAGRLRAVLSAGDTRDPMQLYVAFRGRAPSTAALLRARDLAA